MKILDLTNKQKSDIKYDIIPFPDGQRQVIIDTDVVEYEWPIRLPVLCQINSRLNNFMDLELIICANKSLKALGVKEIHLGVPYFLGSRSDIKFEEGSNNYLKDVICPIINLQKFASVTVLDAHSIALENCIDNFENIDNSYFVQYALFDTEKGIYPVSHSKQKEEKINKFILISPDAGADKKIYKLAKQIGYTGDIITCAKIRDLKTGKITHTNVPMQVEVYNDKDFVIVDDICDGGRTFIEVAKAIRKLYPDKENKIYLIVTHGIFSKGFGELDKYFDGFYTTNSYRDFSDFSGIGWDKNKLKQLNIF